MMFSHRTRVARRWLKTNSRNYTKSREVTLYRLQFAACCALPTANCSQLAAYCLLSHSHSCSIPAMRTCILAVAIVFILNDWGGQRHSAHSITLSTPIQNSSLITHHASLPNVDFDSQIKPILQSKCMPCHFSGGAQYEKLPFDRPETIRKLGEKLFTRIHDENQRRLIRDFLAQ